LLWYLNAEEEDVAFNEKIFRVLKSIEGPWSFLYWKKSLSTLWFGRNPIGQRSLLIHFPKGSSDNLVISSVVPCLPQSAFSSSTEEDVNDWREVPTSGIFSIRFSSSSKEGGEAQVVGLLEHCPWSDRGVYGSFLSTLLFGKRTSVVPCHNSTGINHVDYVSLFLEQLKAAVAVRVSHLPIARSKDQNSANIGLLFSGGIDSMILAVLVDQCLAPEESIDLLNVAFELPTPSSSVTFDVPDRRTGLAGLQELQKISKRQWNFVCINVTLEEMKRYQAHILSLIYPRTTVMDVAIGNALWFAARGIGIPWRIQRNSMISGKESLVETEIQTIESNSSSLYRSSAKVLLSGLGADEQLAGYGRHRTVFNKFGWSYLQKELEIDFDRLWQRNLGRDDRVMSDHGREVRFPFLAESVVRFLNSIPLWEICNLKEPVGFGDKMILRKMGRLLGLTHSTTLSKRAIQFGSRVDRVLFPNTRTAKIDGHAKFVHQ